jgi:GT2 family glycosyltransferase
VRPGADKDPPLVSVSLITYNAARWLDGCLSSLFAQTHPNVELLVLDNGSTDGTRERLEAATAGHPAACVVLSPANLGFAKGHNRAIAEARGEYVCLLNQDMVLDPEFLGAALAAFDAPGVGSVQGRLRWLTPDLERTNLVDSTGLQINRSRRITSRGQGSPDGPHHDRAELLFGVDGACPVYRRSALEDVRLTGRDGPEYLDEDFFMYKEDVDLAWRLLLRGWDAAYAPAAVAWHARGAGESAAKTAWEVIQHRRGIPTWVKRLSWRNQRLMQIKNEDASLVVRDLPRVIGHELAALAYLIVSNPTNVTAVVDLVRMAPAALRKRRQVQRLRRISRRDLAAWFA